VFVTVHTQQQQATYQSYDAVSRRILARFESSRVESRGRKRQLRQLEGICAADFAEDEVESDFHSVTAYGHVSCPSPAHLAKRCLNHRFCWDGNQPGLVNVLLLLSYRAGGAQPLCPQR